MTSTERAWPSEEQAKDLHARLLADDPTAASDLADAYLEPLASWVERTNPRVDDHICGTAAEDAILSLIKNPTSFNPALKSLEAFLRMSATMDLTNLLRTERRHRMRRTDLAAVELSDSGRKFLRDRTDPAVIVERQADQEALEAATAPRPVPEKVRAGLTPEEARVLELMRLGERKTSIFAQALGIAHLPVQAQRQEVYRTKDRLRRRLERAGGSDD